MAKNLRGNQDDENGANNSYTIQGRGVVKRNQLVKEVEKGKPPEHQVVEVDSV